MKTKLFALMTAVLLLLALTGCHKAQDLGVTTVSQTIAEAELTTEAEETTEAEAETTEKTVSTTVVKNVVKLNGTWQDRYSQRATLEVRGGKDQKYQLHVHWGNSAMETEDWSMTGTFNDSTGELTYKKCTRKTLTFDEEGGAEKETVHYTDGTGKFLYQNGELRWQADNDTDVNECVFVR